MSGSSRRSNKKRISYAEVDSDVDSGSDGEEGNSNTSSIKGIGKVKKTSGDTYGTTEGSTRSKKRARKSNSKKNIELVQQEEEEEEQAVYDPKLLLDMPFDVFAETCSHLEGADLISFAQVNKEFRRTLLSQSAQPIWTRRRMVAEWTSLLTATIAATLIFVVTSAGSVSRSYRLISSRDIESQWVDLHPRATECVRFESQEYRRNKTDQIYLIDELDDVDQTLKDLEDEDEAIQAERDKVKYTSSTRSRPRKTVDLPTADKVNTYVRARREWVKTEEKLSVKLGRAMAEREQAVKVAQQEKESKRREKITEARDYLEEFGGWLDDELVEFFDESRFHRTPTFGRGVPLNMPQDDPEPWEIYRSQIEEKLAESQEEQARNMRQEIVRRDFHSQAIGAVEDLQAGLVVDQYEFVELSTVRPLWKPDGADSSQEAFTELLPSIVEQIQEHQEKSRVKAIRSILASNAGVPISNYLLNSSDYPPDEYDSDFFELATSVFYSYSPGALTFPELVKTKQGLSWIRNGISLRQKDAVLAMLEAAELDPANATWNDLVELGQRFKWKNRPLKRSRRFTLRGYHLHHRAVWDCNSLLSQIMADGPKNKEIEQGKGVEIELVADDE